MEIELAMALHGARFSAANSPQDIKDE